MRPSPLATIYPKLAYLFRVDLKGATGLPLMVSHAFVQYELGGQLFTTETVEQDTHNPVLEYSFLHHVERVSPEVMWCVNTCTRAHGIYMGIVRACVNPFDNVCTFAGCSYVALLPSGLIRFGVVCTVLARTQYLFLFSGLTVVLTLSFRPESL